MKILVVGSGGREHAICWKLAQSQIVSEIICVPGNGGTASEQKCRNINPEDCSYLTETAGPAPYVRIAETEHCGLAVIGPEDPLADGIADLFHKAGIPCVGPMQAGARLEASKDFAKHFMHTYGVACAYSETFSDEALAHRYIDQHGAPVVIKADGLAAGKGVTVAATVADAHAAVTDIMDSGRIGTAGSKIVIEEYLEGVEMSVLAAVSVTPDSAAHKTILPFIPARDHKRLLDGARGPNTGGMGAVAPLSDVTDDVMKQFDEDIVQPTLKGLIAEQMDYRGFIFFGVMLTEKGPKLLEYNVRLGDPETQAVLPLMDSDFAALCKAITDGSLHTITCTWKKGFAVAPVAVSGGYPGPYRKGLAIHVDQAAFADDAVNLFIAGAAVGKDQKLITSGGRVLACSARGATFEEAWKKAYLALGSVQFDDIYYRRDIGLPGAAESGNL